MRRGNLTEQKGQNVILLCFVVFLLAVVWEVLNGWETYLPNFLQEQGVPSATISLYVLFASLTIPLFATFLVLLGVYWVGRNIDLQTNLRVSILSLLSGAYLGSWVGGAVILQTDIPPELSSLPAILANLVSIAFLQIFFIAFTALSLAHLRSP